MQPLLNKNAPQESGGSLCVKNFTRDAIEFFFFLSRAILDPEALSLEG